MEKNSNETKKTMLMLAIGFYIIYMFIGASTPGLNYYLLAGPIAGVTVSLLTFCGWILMYNSLSRLEMSYNEPLFCVAKLVSILGMGLYIIYLIIIILGYLLPESVLSAYVKGAVYVSGYVWLRRSITFMLIAVYMSRTIIGVVTVMAFHRALLKSYKNINKISVINELVCILVVILHVIPIFIMDSYSWYDPGFWIILLLYKLLQIGFVVYIYSLNKRVVIYSDYSNGSVFNRIPEDEYQDFLNKMKN